MRSLLNKEGLKHRLERLQKQIKLYEDQVKPSTHFSYWGGENYGMFRGQIMILEELLDELEERDE